MSVMGYQSTAIEFVLFLGRGVLSHAFVNQPFPHSPHFRKSGVQLESENKQTFHDKDS